MSYAGEDCRCGEAMTYANRAKVEPHHPHYGHPTCDDEDCGCGDYLYCYVCEQPWPCETKQAHVAARKVAKA